MATTTTTSNDTPYAHDDHQAQHQEEEENSGGSDDVFKYLIVRPEKGGIRDLFWYWAWGDIDSGVKFLEGSEEGIKGDAAADDRLVILVSIIVRRIISVLGKPMEYTGYGVDFFLNVLSENDGLFGLFLNLLKGNVVIPQRDTETFISTIGHLDGRIDLYGAQKLLGTLDAHVSAENPIEAETGNRALMDLCILASKLAYENAKVVRNVIVQHWKMHFVAFYDCWNDFQKEMSTQVFIACDKPTDANLILISFRGTEPFDADDWSTDFDYSWYEIPKLGKVHMGFLEALGLGNRAETATFHYHLQQMAADVDHSDEIDTSGPLEGTESVSSTTGSDGAASSHDKKKISPEKVKKTAYYTVRKTLKALLSEHKNAKFVVTGHSLGGALAILFPSVLVLHEEMEVMQRLLGVYTFGQPRIGNMQLCKYMEAHLQYPIPKYFRVVYCNDLVPRLPYDDQTFLYKHFGVCLYYNSLYIEQKVDEEPDKNFFGLRYAIPVHLNAMWELIRSLTMGYTHGPEYKEGWFSILARIIGLALPGVSAHCPTDYVNSVRLGRERGVQMSPL
ncbi:hypothetical protein Tsubulata_027518 [Turnera subulata]|uniref:Fungal lipase-type domain-containing protein n=1 Tax=Turnera subulata TaxID=218843 RepID=A0A9Q0G6H2_9ROSI|nr:hypothetical protein Tsubulata_027518 [Turnera subulata]